MKSFLDFEEKSVEKAVQKACEDLNVTREKLKYDIISHGSSGIFGLVGAKKALIRVFVPDLPAGHTRSDSTSNAGGEGAAASSDISQTDRDTVNALVDEAFGESKDSDKTPEPAAIAPKPKKMQKAEKISKPKKAEKPKAVGTDENQKKSDSVSPRGPRQHKSPGKPEKTRKSAPAEMTQTPDTDEIVTSETLSHVDVANEMSAPEATTAIAPAAESAEPVDPAAILFVARELAVKIFAAMGIDAELSENSDPAQCAINIKVPEPGILIGKRGQTLEAIQYIVDKVVNKQCGKGSRVIFDVEGYVESRKTELEELAVRLAGKAVKTGKPSTMTRMNAHDRRIVHVTLKQNRSVRTQSVGDGYYRKLIIFPKKKVHKKSEKTQATE